MVTTTRFSCIVKNLPYESGGEAGNIVEPDDDAVKFICSNSSKDGGFVCGVADEVEGAPFSSTSPFTDSDSLVDDRTKERAAAVLIAKVPSPVEGNTTACRRFVGGGQYNDGLGATTKPSTLTTTSSSSGSSRSIGGTAAFDNPGDVDDRFDFLLSLVPIFFPKKQEEEEEEVVAVLLDFRLAMAGWLAGWLVWLSG